MGCILSFFRTGSFNPAGFAQEKKQAQLRKSKRDGADAENPVSASEQGQKSENISSTHVEEEPEARVEFAELSTSSKIKLSSQSASQVKESKPPDESEEENSDSKEALAATKIQAGFRGYKTRKILKLGQGNVSPAISPEPPKTPEIEISGEILENSDLNEKVTELLVTLKRDENSLERVGSIEESSILMNPSYVEIETSVDEPEENIPETCEVEIECEKGTMTSEIPIMDATTATEVIDDIVLEAENIVATKSTPSSPPNIIHESLAAVEVSESLADSIIQEVGTTLLNKSDSNESDDMPEEKFEPVVMRRKSKRDSALDKKTRSQYRSGVVGLEDTGKIMQQEPPQLPSVDEVEAIVEHEMLEHAATRIQAGFRGYKARKSINKGTG